MNKKLLLVLSGFVYKFTPIKENRIVFESYHGHYADSPRMIYEYCAEKYPEYDYVWIIDKKNTKDIPDNLKYVSYDDVLEKARIKGSARAIIENFYGNSIAVYKKDKLSFLQIAVFKLLHCKKRQLYFTTFHGTPFKKLGRDKVNNDVADYVSYHTEMIFGNRYSAEKFSHITFGKILTRLIGCPRNAILFQTGIKNSLYKKLKLDEKYKYVLYAPTFRSEGNSRIDDIQNSGIEQLSNMDIDSLLSHLNRRFGGEWRLICRFHQHVQNKVDWDTINKTYHNRVINGNESEEMSEYLCISDVLITDYSSSMFDYSLTFKPCFLFVPDLKNYLENERGLYFEIDELPFPHSESFSALLDGIDSFDDEKYRREVQKLHENLGFVDSEKSTERVSEYIIKRICENV